MRNPLFQDQFPAEKSERKMEREKKAAVWIPSTSVPANKRKLQGERWDSREGENMPFCGRFSISPQHQRGGGRFFAAYSEGSVMDRKSTKDFLIKKQRAEKDLLQSPCNRTGII